MPAKSGSTLCDVPSEFTFTKVTGKSVN